MFHSYVWKSFSGYYKGKRRDPPMALKHRLSFYNCTCWYHMIHVSIEMFRFEKDCQIMAINCKIHPCFPAGVQRSPFRSVCLQKPVFSSADAADAWSWVGVKISDTYLLSRFRWCVFFKMSKWLKSGHLLSDYWQKCVNGTHNILMLRLEFV